MYLGISAQTYGTNTFVRATNPAIYDAITFIRATHPTMYGAITTIRATNLIIYWRDYAYSRHNPNSYMA